MTAEIILAIIQALTGSLPQLIELFSTAKSGGTVTATQVQAILTQYGIDRAVFAAAIAKSEEAAASATAVTGSRVS